MTRKYSLSIIVILLFFSSLFANQGGEDTFGYMWTDSKTPTDTVSYDWIDARDGTAIFSTLPIDDNVQTVNLPFNFSFYGTQYNQGNSLWVSTNGFVSFTSLGNSYPNNTDIPNTAVPNNIIAAYWDDLYATSTEPNVYYKTIGTSPNRKFVIMWDYVLIKANGARITFEIILYETSHNIKVQYNVVTSGANGVNATVGIEDNGGTTGSVYSSNSQDFITGLSAILFHRQTLGSVARAKIQPNSVQAGTNFQSFKYTLYNIDLPNTTRLGKVDRVAILNPIGNSVTITSIKINNHNAPIQYNQVGPNQPGFATWYYYDGPTSDSIVVQTSYFDVIDSLVINFVENIPTGTSSGLNFVSTYDARLDNTPAQNASQLVSGDWEVDIVGSSISYYDFVPTTPLTAPAGTGVGFRVTARDVYGNSVINSENIVFTASGSGSVTFSPSNIIDFNGASYVDVTVTDNTAGSFTVIGQLQGSPGISGQSDLVTMEPTTADHFVILPGTDDPITVRKDRLLQVALEDQYNNRIEGSNVTFTILEGNGIFGPGPSPQTVPTNSNGVAQILYSASTLTSYGSDEIQISSGVATDVIVMSLLADVVSYYEFVPSGTRSTTVGVALQYVIRAKDKYGNRRTNNGTVNLSTVGSVSANYSPASPSFAGRDSLTFQVTPNTPGTFKVKATNSVDQFVVGESGTITANPGSPASLVALSTTDTTITVANTLTFRVRIQDALGNGLSGYSIIFERLSGSGTFVGDGASVTRTSQTGGIATATYQVSETSGGSDQVRARYAGGGINTIQFNMTRQPGDVSYYIINPTLPGDYDYQAGTNFSLNVQAYDVYNNLATLSTRAVTLSTTAPGNTVISPNPANLSNGSVSFTVRNIVKQTGLIYTVQDGFGKSANSNSFTIDPSDLDYYEINSGPKLSGISLSGANKDLTIDSTWVLYAAGFDQYDNYINDMSTAEWSTTGGLQPALTDFPGASLFYSPTSSGVSGTITVADGVDGTVTGDQTGTVTVNQGAASQIRITLTAGGAELGNRTFTANETLQLYASLFDAGGSYLGLASGTWTISPASLGKFQNGNSTITDDNPVFRADKVGTGNIQLVYSGVSPDVSGLLTVNVGAANYIVIRDQANGGGSRYDAQTVNMTTDGSINLYAAHYDIRDNYINEASVTWTSTTISGDGLIPVPAGPASSITFSPTGVGSGRIRTTSGTITNDETGDINVAVGALDHIVIQDNSGPSGNEINTLTLNAGATVLLYASGYDRDGNYINNQSSNWSLSGDLIGIFQTPNPTAVNTFEARTTGSGVIEAAGGGKLDRTSSITVNPGNPATLTKIAESDNQSGPVGQPLPIPIRVEVRDNFNNPVPNRTVTWLPKAGGTATPVTSQTNQQGIAETSWTLHNTTSQDILAAYISGIATTPDTVSFTATPQPSSNLTLQTSGTTSFSGTVLQQVGPMRVLIRDDLANPVPNVEVSFAIVTKPSGSSGESLTTYNATTNSSGIAQTNLVLGSKLGTYTVRAFANTSPSYVQFTGTANTPASPDSIIILSGNNQSGTVAQRLADSVKVKLVDQYLNPIPAVTLVFEPLNGGSANPTTAVTTTSGLARSAWTLGNTVGTYNLRVRTQNSAVISDILAATAIQGNPANVSLVSIRGITGDNISAIGNSSVPFIIRVTDAYNNPVPNVTVNSQITQGPNAILANTTSVTNSAGEFTNSVIIDTTDLTTVRSYITGVDDALANIYRVKYIKRSLNPSAVSLGEAVGFAVNIRNPGPRAVSLSTSQSYIRFSDGSETYQATATTNTIPASTSNYTINFNTATVDPDFIPTNYQPEVFLRGTGTDNQFAGSFLTNTGDLQIYTVELVAARVESPSSKIVSRGGQLIAQLEIQNDGGVSINVNNPNTKPVIKSGGVPVTSNFTKTGGPDVISPSSTAYLEYSFSVPTDFTIGNYVLDGQFQGTIASTGAPVSDNEATTTDNFEVISGASTSYLANSLTPLKVNAGDSASFSLIVENGGDVDLILQAAGTYLSFDADDIYLASDQVLPGNGQVRLIFKRDYINSAVNSTPYTPTLYLSGLESGSPYWETISVSNSISVSSIPLVQVSAFDVGVSSASQGQGSIQVTFNVVNTSTPPFPRDEIVISSPYDLVLRNNSKDYFTQQLVSPTPAQFPITIVMGNSRTFTYNIALDENYATGSDTYWVEFYYKDQNTSRVKFKADSVSGAATDDLLVLSRSNLVINSIEPLESDTVSQGQDEVIIRMQVTNTGQSQARLTSASLSFLNNHTIVSQPVFPVSINGSNSVYLNYEVTINPTAALGEDPISGTLVYRDTLNKKDYNFTGTGGSLFIQSFNQALISLNSISVDKYLVNQGQTLIPTRVKIINNGQASIRINGITLQFSPQPLGYTLVSPALPLTLTAGQQQIFNYNINVPAGASTGIDLIDAQVNYTELNSGNTFNKTGAENNDSLLIQLPAEFVITPVLVNTLPSDTVSAGNQNITVSFEAINSGEANARINQVTSQIVPDIGAVSLTRLSPATLPTLQSGDTARFIYRAAAGDVEDSYSVDFSVRGEDLNDNSVIGPQNSSAAGTLVIAPPGQLLIDSVVVAKEILSVGSSSDAFIYLRNGGKSNIIVNSIVMKFNGSTSGFGQSPQFSTPFIIAGNDTSRKLFDVSVLPNAPFGQVVVDAQATGTEQNLNKPVIADGAVLKDTINIINVGQVFIDSTFTDSLPNPGHANLSQKFVVATRLQNTGEDALNNVKISLFRGPTLPNTNLLVADTVVTMSAISELVVAFEQQALPIAGTVYYRSQIDSAISQSTGLPVTIGSPLDNWTDLKIQTPAVLQLTAVPPKFRIPIGLDTMLTATLANQGQAFFDSARVELVFPDASTYSLITGDTIQTVYGNTPSVQWRIKGDSLTKGSAVTYDSFYVKLLDRPKDINIDTTAILLGSDSLLVEGQVWPAGYVRIDSIHFIPRETLLTDTISTGQQFTVRAWIQFIGTIRATGRSATLTLPPNAGFLQITNLTQNLDSSDTLSIVNWVIQAPSDTSIAQLLSILGDSTEQNSGALNTPAVSPGSLSTLDNGSQNIIESARRLFNVTARGVEDPSGMVKTDTVTDTVIMQQKAALNLQARISSPNGAQDQVVSTNQFFEIEIWTENAGEAATYGESSVKMTLPTGFFYDPSLSKSGDSTVVLADDTYLTKIFTGISPISQIQAIKLELTEAAKDYNSGLPAFGGQYLFNFNTMRIVSRAELNLKILDTTPESISQDANFQIWAQVEKSGTAAVITNPEAPGWGDSILVTLDLGEDTSDVELNGDKWTKKVHINDLFSWNLHSKVNVSDTVFSYVTSIDSFPLLDENFNYSDTTVFIGDTLVQGSIDIIDQEKIAINSIYLATPADTSKRLDVSTQQENILVHVDITFNPVYAYDRRATISLPKGFPALADPVRILPDTVSTMTVDWYLTAPAVANQNYQEIRVVISGKSSPLPSEPVTSATESLWIRVRNRANLLLTALIEKEGSGGGANDISYGQIFTFRTTVENRGDVGVYGDARLNLKVSNNLKIAQVIETDTNWVQQHIQPFQTDSSVAWTVKADSNSQTSEILAQIADLYTQKKELQRQNSSRLSSAGKVSQPLSLESVDSKINNLYSALAELEDSLEVTYNAIPFDSLSGITAYANPSMITEYVHIFDKAEIEIVSMQIPDTLSSNQIFQITANISTSPQISQTKTATLTFPGKYESTLGFRTDKIKNFTGNNVSWTVTAPAWEFWESELVKSGGEPVAIAITFEAKDVNTNDNIVVVDSLRTFLQKEAKLGITKVIITDPPGSQGLLTFNQNFTIQATIKNYGEAGALGGGILTLDLDPDNNPYDIVYQQGETQQKSYPDISGGDSTYVQWKLTTGPQRRITASLKVSFDEDHLPDDQNKGADVNLDPARSVGAVAVSTEYRVLTVSRVPHISGSPSVIETQGVPNLPILGFRLLNQQRTVLYDPDMVIDTITVQLVENDGLTVIENPAAIISRIKVTNTLNSDILFAKLQTDPTLFADFSLVDNTFDPANIKIAFSEPYAIPASTEPIDSLVIWVDIHPSAPNKSCKLRLIDMHTSLEDLPGSNVPVEDQNGVSIKNPGSDGASDIVTVVSSSAEEVFSNYPNPFGITEKETKFVFFAQGSGTVEIKIYTLLGGLVWSSDVNVQGQQLYDGLISWNGLNNAGNEVLNGVYLAVIKIDGQTYKTKVAYIK
jgi:hypothetical protein